MAGNESDETSKEPFVSQSDRPEVRIKSDTPLSELTVRDLASLLAQVGGGGDNKDFWDGKDWQKDDFDGGSKWKDKEKEKEKPEKWEVVEKPPKWEKNEKLEKEKDKREVKETKVEKLESDFVVGPSHQIMDPRLDQVIQALSGLTARVAQLADQVEELRRGHQG
jgi:hypothetical protein